MNVYTRFDEIPSMTLQDIKEDIKETLSMHIQKPFRIRKGNNSDNSKTQRKKI